jgi:DNA-binding NtrC family response regulator
VIMKSRDKLDVFDLPEAILLRTVRSAAGREEAVSLQAAREKFEREFILQKLVEMKGSVSRAAHAMQVERSNLYRKMRQLGIPYSGREDGETE